MHVYMWHTSADFHPCLSRTHLYNHLSNFTCIYSYSKRVEIIAEPSSISNRKPMGKRRTESEQQRYSSKLINCVLALRRADSAAATARNVRRAADRILVNSAKGKSRWSRALLNRRLKRKQNRPGSGVWKKRERLQRKVGVLSRLIPGCRKLSSVGRLIEETTDYIAALEMQVKAMALLNALLNAGTLPNPAPLAHH